MKKSIWLIFLIIVIICAIVFFVFQKNMSKVLKNGNNMSSQEIVDYILSISSYKANVTVNINSNKNSNKYIINQEYISPNTNKQEIVEPENISGVRIIRNENGLTLENTRLDLSNIYENYEYIADNCLDLSSFINDYSSSNKSNCEEKDNEIIMKTVSKNSNSYTKNKTLYINKETLKPQRLEIKDNNQKTTVNILYNEVEITVNNQ